MEGCGLPTFFSSPGKVWKSNGNPNGFGGESQNAEVLKELDKIVDYLTIYKLIMARTQSSLSVKKRTPSVSLENNFFLQPALSQVSPVVVNANARNVSSRNSLRRPTYIISSGT